MPSTRIFIALTCVPFSCDRLIVTLITIQGYASVLYFRCLGTEIFLSFQIINDDPHLYMVSTINVPMTCLMIPIYVSDATYR